MCKRLVITIAVMFAVTSLAFAQDFTAPDIMKISGKLSPSKLQKGREFQLSLVIDIKKGFHANANTPTADFPTEVKMSSGHGISFGRPEYPAPLMKSFSFSPEKIPVYDGRIVVKVPGKVESSTPAGEYDITGEVSYQACDDMSCYPPSKVKFSIPVNVVEPDGEAAALDQPSSDEPELAAQKQQEGLTDKRTNELVDKIRSGGLPFLFIAGLLLCLSPCVYPMIPIIVGYFGGQGQGRRGRVGSLAFLFVIGLAITYSILGTAAAFAGSGLGNVMQHPAVPVFVAGVLIALALSLFGLYDIPVPSFIANKSQARSGALGALFMGLVFGLVAAPCVGPVVVALLFIVAQDANPIQGFIMFFILSLGLGTPFFFLAVFSGSLARIPRPGSWMVTIRKVFGFLLLGAALYYLAQLLPRDIARLVIPAFLVITGLYWAVFERSTREMRIVRPVQQFLGIVVIAWAVWTLHSPSSPSIVWTPYTREAVEAAKQENRPVIIDFTAAWCKPCEEMEKTTFADSAVKKEASRFTRLSVDLTRHSKTGEKAQKDYKAPAPPIIVLIGSDGEEKDRVVGYIKPTEFLERLRRVE